MKKKIMVIVTLAVFLAGSVVITVMADEAKIPVPKSGNYRVDSNIDPKSDFRILEVLSDVVIFLVPLVETQYNEEKLKDPDWRILASYAWTDGQTWYLVVKKNYDTQTQLITGNKFRDCSVGFPLKPESNGWWWVRVWGQDRKTQKWLWINQGSRYCRKDIQGNPGYEFLVNLKTKEHIPVPEEYKIRK